jgi:hypothetical protein
MGLMSLFIKKTDVAELQGEYEKTLKALRATKEELEELKLKKRLEAEEIKHMQRINEEKMKMELENEKAKINKQYAEDIGRFKEEQRVELVNSLKDFHKKMEERFCSELVNMKEIYNMLTEKLPNVNYNIEKKITQKV